MSFIESDLESLIIDLIKNKGYTYIHGDNLERTYDDILIETDLRSFLKQRYNKSEIEDEEVNSIIL